MSEDLVTPYVRRSVVGNLVGLALVATLWWFLGLRQLGFPYLLLGILALISCAQARARVRIAPDALYVRNWFSWRRIQWQDIHTVRTVWNWSPFGRVVLLVLTTEDADQAPGFWASQFRDLRAEKVSLNAVTVPFRGLGLLSWRPSAEMFAEMETLLGAQIEGRGVPTGEPSPAPERFRTRSHTRWLWVAMNIFLALTLIPAAMLAAIVGLLLIAGEQWPKVDGGNTGPIIFTTALVGYLVLLYLRPAKVGIPLGTAILVGGFLLGVVTAFGNPPCTGYC